MTYLSPDDLLAEPLNDDGLRLYRADLWGPPSERDLAECWFPEKPDNLEALPTTGREGA